MTKERILLILLFSTTLFLTGCAKDSVLVTVDPLEYQTVAVDQSSEKWNMRVRQVNDLRPIAAVNAASIGSVDQRFGEADLAVNLDPPPAELLKRELSRFLFKRGLEASSDRRARVFLDINIRKFDLTRDSTGVSDISTLDVEYAIDFFTAQGELLGTVTLPDSRWIKNVSPFTGTSDYKQLVTDSLTATFNELTKTKTYAEAAAR